MAVVGGLSIDKNTESTSAHQCSPTWRTSTKTPEFAGLFCRETDRISVLAVPAISSLKVNILPDAHNRIKSPVPPRIFAVSSSIWRSFEVKPLFVFEPRRSEPARSRSAARRKPSRWNACAHDGRRNIQERVVRTGPAAGHRRHRPARRKSNRNQTGSGASRCRRQSCFPYCSSSHSGLE